MFKLLSLNTIIELICFLISAFCLIKDGSKIWKTQIFYLAIICFTEILGRSLIKQMHYKSNYWLYNIFLVFELAFVCSMFYYLFQSFFKKGKYVILSGIILFAGSYTYDLATHGFWEFNNFCNTVISIFYCFCCLYYFYLLLKDERYFAILKLAPFWWVTGAFFYYFGSTACDIYFDSLVSIQDHSLRKIIILLLNIILYSCWSYSFICRKWVTSVSKA